MMKYTPNRTGMRSGTYPSTYPILQAWVHDLTPSLNLRRAYARASDVPTVDEAQPEQPPQAQAREVTPSPSKKTTQEWLQTTAQITTQITAQTTAQTTNQGANQGANQATNHRPIYSLDLPPSPPLAKKSIAQDQFHYSAKQKFSSKLDPNAHSKFNHKTDSLVIDLIQVMEDGCTADEVQKYINKGADINFRGKWDVTPFIAAAQRGRADIVRLLLTNGIDVDAQDINGSTALISAVSQGHEDVVGILIESKANLNVQTQLGNTAIMRAASLGRLKIVKMLLAAGADLDIKNIDGCTVLDCAKEHLDIFNMLSSHIIHKHFPEGLMQQEEDEISVLKDPDDCLSAPIFLRGCDTGNIKCIEQILRRGVDIDARDVEGCTGLMHAVYRGHIEAVKILLENKANCNLQNQSGWTALMFAVNERKTEMVALLLGAGARVDLKDDKGYDALYCAGKNKPLIKMLNEHAYSQGIVVEVEIQPESSVDPYDASIQEGLEQYYHENARESAVKNQNENTPQTTPQTTLETPPERALETASYSDTESAYDGVGAWGVISLITGVVDQLMNYLGDA